MASLEVACHGLTTFPERGNVPKELRTLGMTEFREVHAGVYRIIYRTTGQQVVIYCVLDGRRDVQSLLEQRLLR